MVSLQPSRGLEYWSDAFRTQYLRFVSEIFLSSLCNLSFSNRLDWDLRALYEKHSHRVATTARHDTGCAPPLPLPAFGQALQGMSGAVSRHLLSAVPSIANSPIAEKSQPLHALIRTGSPGRGDQNYFGPVCRHSRFYRARGATPARGSRHPAQSLLRARLQGYFSLRRHAGQARRRSGHGVFWRSSQPR